MRRRWLRIKKEQAVIIHTHTQTNTHTLLNEVNAKKCIIYTIMCEDNTPFYGAKWRGSHRWHSGEGVSKGGAGVAGAAYRYQPMVARCRLPPCRSVGRVASCLLAVGSWQLAATKDYYSARNKHKVGAICNINLKG